MQGKKLMGSRRFDLYIGHELSISSDLRANMHM